MATAVASTEEESETRAALLSFLGEDLSSRVKDADVRLLAQQGYTSVSMLKVAQMETLKAFELRGSLIDAIIYTQKQAAGDERRASGSTAGPSGWGAGVSGEAQLASQLTTVLMDGFGELKDRLGELKDGIGELKHEFAPMAANFGRLLLHVLEKISVAPSSIRFSQCQEIMQRFGFSVREKLPPCCFTPSSTQQLQAFADMPTMTWQVGEDRAPDIEAFMAHMAEFFSKLGLDLELLDVHGVSWLEAMLENVHIKLSKTDYLVMKKGSIPPAIQQKVVDRQALTETELCSMLHLIVALIESKTTAALTTERSKCLAQGGAEFIAVNVCASGNCIASISGNWRIPVIVTDGNDHSAWHQVGSEAHLVTIPANRGAGQGGALRQKMYYFLQQLLQNSLQGLPSGGPEGGPGAGPDSGSGHGAGLGEDPGSDTGGPGLGPRTFSQSGFGPGDGSGKRQNTTGTFGLPTTGKSVDSSDAAACDLIEQLDRDVWIAQALATMFRAVEKATGTPVHVNLADVDIRQSRWFKHAE